MDFEKLYQKTKLQEGVIEAMKEEDLKLYKIAGLSESGKLQYYNGWNSDSYPEMNIIPNLEKAASDSPETLLKRLPKISENIKRSLSEHYELGVYEVNITSEKVA
jgi:hypothetical protein